MRFKKMYLDYLFSIIAILLALLLIFCNDIKNGQEMNDPPSVSFDEESYEGFVSEEIYLYASLSDSEADPLSITWDFGDDTTDTATVYNYINFNGTTHEFDTATEYTVTLTVNDGHNPPVTATTTAKIYEQLEYSLVPGTGQETYYDNSGAITDPQDIALFPGQDAEQAEEVTFVVINDTSSGNPIIIRDPVRGWEWQADSISPLLTYDEAVAECDGLDLGGNSDWYLGSRPMLQSIVNYGIVNTGEAATFEPFQDTTVAGQYWTTSPDFYNTDNRMMVDFGSFEGNMGASFPIATSLGGNDQTAYCRCVRGPEIPTDHSYVDNGDDTVTDQTTGLMILKKPLAAVAAVGPFWQDALVYCDESTVGGYDDWIVPNIKQLASLTAFSQTQPPLLDDVFDLSEIQYNFEFWSSTTQWFEPTAAWTINLNNGAIYPDFYAGKIAYERNVMCVRKPDQ